MGPRRTNSALAVAAAAVTLLAAGCTSAVQGEAIGRVATSTTPASSSAPESSAVTSAAAALPESETVAPVEEIVLIARAGIDRSTDGGQTWERIETPATPNALTTDGTTVLAVATTEAGATTGTVLSSADRGSTWSVAANGTPVFELLAHGPDGFLAVGLPQQAGYPMDDGTLDLTVGSSADGTTWTTTPVSVPVGGTGDASLAELTWNGTLWSIPVVSGHDESTPATEILTSPDGVTWTAGALWPPVKSLAPASMAWTGQAWGWVGHVLDGYTYDTDFLPHTRPVTGSSNDGTAWTAAVPAPADGYLQSLTCTGSGWLALSLPWWDQDQTVPPQLRHSTDLATWEPQGTGLPVVQTEIPGYATGADLLVLGSDPDPAACGSAVTTPVDEFVVVPPAGPADGGGGGGGGGGSGTGPDLTGVEGDGWCESTGAAGVPVILVSNVTVYEGSPPSTLYCDHMTETWAADLGGTPVNPDLPCTAEGFGAASAQAGYVAGCPVSAKFAFDVAETGSAAAATLLAELAATLDRLRGTSGATPPGAAPPGGSSGEGDLGLSTKMSLPPCDGSVAVIVGSLINPGAYAAEVQAMLDAHPGASYVRTNLSCSSFRQSFNGNAIYAVYFLHPPGTGCEAVYAQGGDANGRILQNSTPEEAQLDC